MSAGFRHPSDVPLHVVAEILDRLNTDLAWYEKYLHWEYCDRQGLPEPVLQTRELLGAIDRVKGGVLYDIGLLHRYMGKWLPDSHRAMVAVSGMGP
jgi:hypothetical protein